MSSSGDRHHLLLVLPAGYQVAFPFPVVVGPRRRDSITVAAQAVLTDGRTIALVCCGEYLSGTHGYSLLLELDDDSLNGAEVRSVRVRADHPLRVDSIVWESWYQGI
jgi:hypothetical protein